MQSKHTDKSDALRLAVRRREEKRERLTPPDGFEDKVMEAIAVIPHHSRRRGTWAWVIAASVAVVMVAAYTILSNPIDTVEPRKQSKWEKPKTERQTVTPRQVEPPETVRKPEIAKAEPLAAMPEQDEMAMTRPKTEEPATGRRTACETAFVGRNERTITIDKEADETESQALAETNMEAKSPVAYMAETVVAEEGAGSAVPPQPASSPSSRHLHYAVLNASPDSSRYTPALVDEFIAKFAAIHGISPVTLECCQDSTDSQAASTAYVFPDTKEIDLYGKLLLIAVAFDDATPGYLLNHSHQQLFFKLHDQHLDRKYLWIAERIGGDKILLYCSHSPIDYDASLECYRRYRETITHTDIHNKIKDI